MSELQQESTGGVLPGLRQNGAIRVIATIISYVFHPLFIPVYLAIAVYKLSPVSFAGISHKQTVLWLISITVNVVFYPLLSLLLLKGLGFIKSIHMREPKERIIPLIMTMIFYFWAYLVAKGNPGSSIFPVMSYPFVLRVFFLANFWGIICVFMINIFLKVSMHTAAMGGMIGLMIVMMMVSPINMMVPLFVAIILAGIVGTARMLLHAHDIGEIWLGYIVGILVQLAAYLYLR